MEFSQTNIKIVVSLVVLFLLTLFKIIGNRRLNKNSRKVYFRNLINFLYVLSTVLIWQQELREFTFSILALIAALSIAMKEFVLCIVGGGYKVLNSLFKIGDRIEIGENLGDVVDNNFLFTKLLEVGPKGLSQQYTGRTICIPNHLLLTQAVHNLTSSKKYSFHVFKHPLIFSNDILLKKKIMHKVASGVCSPYLKEARNELRASALIEGLDAPKIDPVISLHFISSSEVEFVIRVPVPVKRRGHYQQKIIHRYLETQGIPR
jgi:small-conductance mechanosensitive channel